ncbi:hypothetical protein [Pseudomonas putida]|uniref:hypothetical protein n=1 Tax=Pseudomonas putida TaxID=303 RepID=UPI002159C5EC|nr:hypothetical protein [Pseudomonas putida]
MTIDHRLRSLETARRRALWALADIELGDARAEKVLDELDEVDQGLQDIVSGDQLSAQELVDVINTKLHNGVQLVVEDSIPEPWLALPAWQRGPICATSRSSWRCGSRSLST